MPINHKLKQRVLVSSCLLNQPVRYDGNLLNFKDHYLEKLVKLGCVIEFCPEFMAGFGVPRLAMELQQSAHHVLLNKKGLISQNGLDITVPFLKILPEIKSLIIKYRIRFAILKENSPSCGVHFVYDGTFTGRLKPGRGIIAEYLIRYGVEILNENEIKRCYDQILKQ